MRLSVHGSRRDARRMDRLAVVFVFALLAFACEDEVPADPTGRASAEPAGSEPPNDEAPNGEAPNGEATELDTSDQVIAPSFSEADLDAMDTPALEAACFEGATAACDRLGH